MRVSVSTLIRAQRPLAFAMAADIKSWPQTISAITAVDLLTREPVGAGTRFRETRLMHGRSASEEMTFSEFEPPERFVLTAESHGARFEAVHLFKDVPDGTACEIAFSARPLSWTARLISGLSFLTKGAVVAVLEADLADLKRAIEARAGADHGKN
ncbi:MAG: SRPBCC family protein [Hyphomicrobium sp.]